MSCEYFRACMCPCAYVFASGCGCIQFIVWLRQQPLLNTKCDIQVPAGMKPPKRSTSAYSFFIKLRKHYPVFAPLPGESNLAGTAMSNLWHGLTPAQKLPFEEHAATDLARYKSEMIVWKNQMQK